MKRKNINVLFITVLTVFYAVSAYAIYQSELNSTDIRYNYHSDRMCSISVENLEYYSDPVKFKELQEHLTEPEEYDFEKAMCELTQDFDDEGNGAEVFLRAVFDRHGNVIAKEGKFFEKPVKNSEITEETDDKQIKTLEKHLERCCEDSMFLLDGRVGGWLTINDNCNYTVLDFIYDSQKYYFFSGTGLDYVKATLKGESFIKSITYISTCYAVRMGFSLISPGKKKES